MTAAQRNALQQVKNDGGSLVLSGIDARTNVDRRVIYGCVKRGWLEYGSVGGRISGLAVRFTEAGRAALATTP